MKRRFDTLSDFPMHLTKNSQQNMNTMVLKLES